MIYIEEQKGWFLIFFFLLFILFFLTIVDESSKSLNFTFIAISLFFIFVFLPFYKLKIILDDKVLELSFGIGLIKKKFLLSEIASAKDVRNKWYYGWGIRFRQNGWLYNIHGLSAVEITFKNKKNFVRIGTISNSPLKKEIQKRIC